MFLTIGSSGSKTGGDSFAGKKKKKKGKARDEMHVKLIVFLWRVECALSPFDWQQLFTWLCDDDFCSCCWNVSHHYRPQSFSGLQSHPDDQTIWLNMSRDCNLLNMCIYIYIYTHIYETGLSGNVVASFFPLIIFILLCFNVLSTVPRENRLADFLYIYIY